MLFIKSLKEKPQLPKYPRKAPLKWRKNIMSWKSAWKNVLFMKEKIFNLGDLDVNNYYWHD